MRKTQQQVMSVRTIKLYFANKNIQRTAKSVTIFAFAKSRAPFGSRWWER